MTEREKAFQDAAEIIWRAGLQLRVGEPLADLAVNVAITNLAHMLQAIGGVEVLPDGDKLKSFAEKLLAEQTFQPIPTYKTLEEKILRVGQEIEELKTSYSQAPNESKN